MPRGLKLPLMLLTVGVLGAGLLTHEDWLPLLTGSAEGRASARPRAGARAAVDIAALLEQEARESERLRGEQQERELEQWRRAELLRGAGEAGQDTKGTAAGDERQSNPAASDTKPASANAEGEGEEKPAPEEEESEAEEEPEPEPFATVEGQVVNPNLHGRLEEVSTRRIRGWVQDRFEQDSQLLVEIQINDQRAYELRAAQRVEHDSLGVIWRFEQEQPRELQDAEQHVIRAIVYRADQHGRAELAGSPRTRNPGTPPRGRVEAASPEAGITGYAWDPDSNRQAVTVILRVDGEKVAEAKADRANAELRERRIAPHENVAFHLPWPAALNDGYDHTIQVFAVDNENESEHELDGSTRALAGDAGLSNEPPIGRFDILNRYTLAGWAWDPDAGEQAISVEVWVDEQPVATVLANSRRQTLLSSRQTPTPNHGFVMPTPAELLDGRTHVVRVFALNFPRGPKVELPGSPRHYRMQENEDPVGGFWHADEDWLRGWAHDPDLGLDPCEIEIYINGTLWQRTKADHPEPWLVGSGHAPNAEHGFRIRPPDLVREGGEHEVTIFAVNYPQGPPRRLGTRTIGINSIFCGFWTNDRLLDTRISRGLQVTSVSPWFDAYHQGVKDGDVLLSYDGIEAGHAEQRDGQGNVTRPGTMTGDFRDWINANKQRNDTVQFVFWRDGDTYSATVKVGQLRGQ
jgi:hypothetical protein